MSLVLIAVSVGRFSFPSVKFWEYNEETREEREIEGIAVKKVNFGEGIKVAGTALIIHKLT